MPRLASAAEAPQDWRRMPAALAGVRPGRVDEKARQFKRTATRQIRTGGTVDERSRVSQVTIVTLSFNQAAYLPETMRSVLEQDYPNLEYIVMDGGSEDGSAAIIRGFSERLAYWQSQPDQGQTDAINQGFARASGEILAWLNSDDLLFPGAVRAAVRQLQAHPEAGMVYGDALLINAAGKKIGNFPAANRLQKAAPGYVHIPSKRLSFARILEQVGPLDPTFYFAMDYDLWCGWPRKRLWCMCRAVGRFACMGTPIHCRRDAAGRRCACTTATGECAPIVASIGRKLVAQS